MIEWLRVNKGLCEKAATELRPDMRNQSWHSGEGCVSSIPASINETSMSEGPKGGQCGWTKGESNGWWDRVRYGPCRRWKEFGVYPKCKHWRVLNRLNLYHFNSTKVPSFHIDLYLYHLLVIFNFNREKHLKSQIVKLVIHLSCLSHNLYRVL